MLRDRLQVAGDEIRIPVDVAEHLPHSSQEHLLGILAELEEAAGEAAKATRERTLQNGIDEAALEELEQAHAEHCAPVIELYDDDGVEIGRCCSECDFEILFNGGITGPKLAYDPDALHGRAGAPPPSTLVVNFFGGPGTGKSTMAMHVSTLLKWRGRNTELVGEYAKDKVWEQSLKVLDNQVYIFGKQQHRLARLDGQVEAAITDAPLLLSLVYGRDYPELCALVKAEVARRPSLNIFLERKKAYNPKGRLQDEWGPGGSTSRSARCSTRRKASTAFSPVRWSPPMPSRISSSYASKFSRARAPSRAHTSKGGVTVSAPA